MSRGIALYCSLLLPSSVVALRSEAELLESVSGDVPCGDLSEKFGLEEDTQIGSYSLVVCLGAGSFSEVWKAKSVGSSGVEVVVKVARSASDENGGKDWRGNDVQHEMLTECIAAQELVSRETNKHYFVDCLELGLATVPKGQTVPFLTMPLVSGRNMEKAWMESGTNAIRELPSREDAMKAEQDIIKATLMQVSRMPVMLHKDMQPSNIILHQGQVTVVDYGEMHFCCGRKSCELTLREGSAVGAVDKSITAPACGDSLPNALLETLRLVYLEALIMLSGWSGGPAPRDPVYGFAFGQQGSLAKAVRSHLRKPYEFTDDLETVLSELPKLLQAKTIEQAKETLTKVDSALKNLIA